MFIVALIYVLEDDINILEIEEIALRNSGYEVEGFAKISDFMNALKKKVPHLFLLDVMLPDGDGLSVVAELRSRPDTEMIPIILVTAKSTELDKVKGLDIGADDYLTKPFGVMELISRVKARLRRGGSGHKDTQIYSFEQICLDDEKHQVTVGKDICELTYKEYELLKLLLSYAGAVITREKILEVVWETDFEGESRTLDMHMKTLRQKLGCAGSLIKTVRNVGYIMSKD